QTGRSPVVLSVPVPITAGGGFQDVRAGCSPDMEESRHFSTQRDEVLVEVVPGRIRVKVHHAGVEDAEPGRVKQHRRFVAVIAGTLNYPQAPEWTATAGLPGRNHVVTRARLDKQVQGR